MTWRSRASLSTDPAERVEERAMGMSIFSGVGLGALGGCVVPLEVSSHTMRQIAHITPQAWGSDAFAKLVGHGASITGILPQLGILAAYAAVLLTLATWRLRPSSSPEAARARAPAPSR